MPRVGIIAAVAEVTPFPVSETLITAVVTAGVAAVETEGHGA